jgi:hypothetical protein
MSATSGLPEERLCSKQMTPAIPSVPLLEIGLPTLSAPQSLQPRAAGVNPPLEARSESPK